jgi:nicotinamidase-related amidase
MKPALLIIDVQVGLFNHPTPVFQAEQLLEAICRLAEKAARAGAPVFYVQHANKTQLLEGSTAWQLHPSLNPGPADIHITKHHGSALKDTPLKAELLKRGIDTLVISGLVTHGCVKATCQDAIQQGYHVVLVSDAHSSYNADAEKLIAEWNQKLAQEGAELHSAGAIQFA